MSGWRISLRSSRRPFGARKSSIGSTARSTVDERWRATSLKDYGEGMSSTVRFEHLRHRAAPLEMTAEQFRSAGHDMVDRVATMLASIRTLPVTPAESPQEVREALAAPRALPEEGKDPDELLRHAADLLF